MTTPAEIKPPTFTPFWPLFLMAVSLTIFLGWQVVQSARQHMGALRLADQQALLAGQAAETETKLQALTMDLLYVSRNDPDAQAIVAKYNIKFNPPASPGGAPSEVPPARPKTPAPSDDAVEDSMPEPEP